MIGKKKWLKATVLTAFVISLTAVGFVSIHGCGSASSESTEELNQMFADAITDASNPTVDKISENLVAIVTSNIDLVWQGEAGNSRLLVATTMSPTAYENYGYKAAYESGDVYSLPDTAQSWVTTVPELINFFKDKGYNTEDVTTLRVEQVLGLQYAEGDKMVVELWVNTSDIFRPSRDPEITDHEASIVYPTDNNPYIEYTDATIKISDTVEYTYKEWFEYRISTVYAGTSAFPFTQLGYTYDWASDNDDHIGLSEFVVKGGSGVYIHDAKTVPEYFNAYWDTY